MRRPRLTLRLPEGKFHGAPRDCSRRSSNSADGETIPIVRGPRRLGFAGSGFDGGMIDLGHEPPLVIGEAEDEGPIRRGVHWRWMTGTILTGFTSIFLMGGALMAALNDPNLFASLPDTTQGLVADTADSSLKFGQKGDRMRPLDDVSSRQILQVSTITRQDERDFIKLRPFAKITASLVAHKELADQVPKYDALSIFAANANSDDDSGPAAGSASPVTAADDQIYGANVDGEVSVKVTDFPVLAADIEASVSLDTPAVEQLVRVAANLPADGAKVAAVPLSGPAAYADDGGTVAEDPFSALGVRITAENVSNVAKSDAAGDSGKKIEEKYISVAKGESFRALLDENGVAGEDIDHIVAALSDLVDGPIQRR